MDAVVPIWAELLGAYERRGAQISGNFGNQPAQTKTFVLYSTYQRPHAQRLRGCVRFDQTIDVMYVHHPELHHHASQLQQGQYYIYETTTTLDPALYQGVLLLSSDSHQERMYLRDSFAQMLLTAMLGLPCLTFNPSNVGIRSAAVKDIRALFEEILLYNVPGKKGWTISGRRAFEAQINYWIQLQKPIQMALPAFPCKTTNRDKAVVSVPDGPEYEALVTLLTFCKRVQGIYEPGCQLCIVSDGHVFSDCIGVDDDAVTSYTLRLHSMLKQVQYQLPITHGGIRFMDLNNLLMFAREQNQPPVPHILHPAMTQINAENDLCRRLLVALFAPPRNYIQDLIKAVPEHSITALYRGFSRFMFEDLAFHPDFRDETKSQRKKAAEGVALEMILRNQAYSRLVESVLPKHIRLSIHAHDNAGPKFAVRLLPGQTVDESVPDLIEDPEQTLHIPTPWHSTLAEIHHREGTTIITCKAKVLRDALENGRLFGAYDFNHPRGGRFMLWEDRAGWENRLTTSTTVHDFPIGIEP